MLDVSEGPASVPAEAWIVEGPEGGPALAWGGDRMEPSEEPVLDAFAGLAEVSGEGFGDAVVEFVRRFGPLGVCQEHGQDIHGPIHRPKGCTFLIPEPLALWRSKVQDVAIVRHVNRALKAGGVPDPFGLSSRQEWDPDIRLDSYRLDIERFKREWGLPFEAVADVYDDIAEWEGELREVHARGAGARAKLRDHQPESPAEWWEWILREVNDGLFQNPPQVHLQLDPGATLPRVALLAFGLLPRVYLALAFEVSGTGEVASCSYCGRLYIPSRAPKSGQRNYCQECRAAHVPQRLHMRERRTR